MQYLGRDDVKRAHLDHEVQEVLARRWSPYSLSSEPVPREDLAALFEAARWAPSSFNEQPWRYVLAARPDEEAFQLMLSCLVEANRVWAAGAAVLALGLVRRNFTRGDKPNVVARHDLGLASAQLVMEAGARGYAVHQMAGVDRERAREVYSVPEEFEVLTALAIGAPAPPEEAPEEVRERDLAPRTRRPLSETVFDGTWGRPASL